MIESKSKSFPLRKNFCMFRLCELLYSSSVLQCQFEMSMLLFKSIKAIQQETSLVNIKLNLKVVKNTNSLQLFRRTQSFCQCCPGSPYVLPQKGFEEHEFLILLASPSVQMALKTPFIVLELFVRRKF